MTPAIGRRIGCRETRDDRFNGPHLKAARTMPECQNCGAFVTKVYTRVFTPPGVENPRVCPECEDKVRDGADVREARSRRR